MSQDVFERYAAEYDRWYDDHRAEYQAELIRIRRVLPAPDHYAIEIGGGSGRFAAPLGIGLVIEPSQALGQLARQRGIEVIRARAEFIPLQDASCSSVLLVTVICFLDSPSRALREIHRILVTRGTLVIGFIERGGAIEQKYRHEKTKKRFLSRACFFSIAEVRALLRTAGFQELRVDSSAGFCVIKVCKD